MKVPNEDIIQNSNQKSKRSLKQLSKQKTKEIQSIIAEAIEEKLATPKLNKN